MVVNFSLFNEKPHVNGIIKYLKLKDWWLNELDYEAREIITNTYSPMGNEGSIIEGDIHSSSQTQLHFLWGLIGWFNKPNLRHIAYLIISKAETLVDEQSDPLDTHFLFGAKLDIYYRDRDVLPNGLELAMQACEQQIKYAPEAAKAFTRKYSGNLPAHSGYRQLAIILEKLGRYAEAIAHCEEAKSQGWTGDWDKRIDRCNKKN